MKKNKERKYEKIESSKSTYGTGQAFSPSGKPSRDPKEEKNEMKREKEKGREEKRIEEKEKPVQILSDIVEFFQREKEKM